MNKKLIKCQDCPYPNEPIEVIFKGDGTGKCDKCDRIKEFYKRNNISSDDLLPNSQTKDTSTEVKKSTTKIDSLNYVIQLDVPQKTDAGGEYSL